MAGELIVGWILGCPHPLLGVLLGELPSLEREREIGMGRVDNFTSCTAELT